MFNWYTAPTFVGMLLCLLAAYVLTRSPRSPTSLLAVAALLAGGAYLLGEGMQANASTWEEWRVWARSLEWGATLGPSLWYWLTLLLLGQQDVPAARRYSRWVGYPLGVLFALGGLVFTAAIYVDDWYQVWGAATQVPPEQVTYFRYRVPSGELYPSFVGLVAATMLGAAVNVALGWRLPLEEARRPRFAWLSLSAALFILGAVSLGVSAWLSADYWPTWLSHLALAAAVAVMAWHVAAYSLLLQGQVIRRDLFYFLTALALICVVYALIFLLAGPVYSFQLLGLLLITLIAAIWSHALVDVARRILDRLFFRSDVRRLRSNLSWVAQSAALTPDLSALLRRAQNDVAEVSEEHFVRLTQDGLRRLNNPAALARCELINRLPHTLAADRSPRGDGQVAAKTPLAQSQALHEVLVMAIERLRPADRGHAERAPSVDDPAAPHYNILREEYLLGMPNVQIITRHSISESTFHRHRREAIAALARELARQEELLLREPV